MVITRAGVDVGRLSELDLVEGYRKYRVLSVSYATFTTEQLREVTGWESVLSLTPDHKLEYYNDDGRELTESARVQNDLD